MKYSSSTRSSSCSGILLGASILVCIVYFLTTTNVLEKSEVRDNKLEPTLISSGFYNDLSSSKIFYDNIYETDVIYVIVGGGPGRKVDVGYPEWTKRRTLAAYEQYDSSSEQDKKKSIFFALSAGSMNGPNLVQEDGRIIFECQHIIKHLLELGVPQEIIFGDFISWDTIGNALTLRLAIEGLQSLSKSNTNSNNISSNRIKPPAIKLEVFTSDFHQNRVQTIFHWVLGLHPSLLPETVTMAINVHNGQGIYWGSAELFKQRLAHENAAIEHIEELKKSIKTFSQLFAYVLLGGHKGYSNYLHSDSKPRSQG